MDLFSSVIYLLNSQIALNPIVFFIYLFINSIFFHEPMSLMKATGINAR